MRGITAEAALLFFWEHNISFVIDNEMLAFSSDIGKDTITCTIVSTSDFISSLSVVGSIVEHLSVKSVSMIGDCECLVIGNGKRRAPNWWWWGDELGGCKYSQSDEPYD